MSIRTVVKLQKGKDPTAVAAKLLQAQITGVYQTAEWIMDKSRDLVPVDSGNLRATAFVELPKMEGLVVSVRLGYGGTAAPYALAVHENPRAGKTGGVGPSGGAYKTWAKVGQWKFLQIPFEQARTDKVFPRLFAKLSGSKL